MGDKNEITTITNNKLAVRTVSVPGTRLPGKAEDEKKYVTTLVQTNDGEVLAMKVFDMNGGGGGGGGGTVDQTYDPTSTNAQSGTAVAEAVAPALKNTATGTNALTILGSATSKNEAINIGLSSSAGTSENVAIGTYAQTSGDNISASGATGASTTAVGFRATASTGTALGSCTDATKGVAIGRGRSTTNKVTASAEGSIAIGTVDAAQTYCKATKKNAIQLGTGTNATADTFQVYSYPMLDGTTGKIPTDRMAKIIELTTTSVELASDNVYNGGELASVTLTLPASVPANFCCQVQFSSGATATTFSATGIFFEGDECVGGTFTPSANHRYSIMIYNDGVNTIGFVYEK